MHQHLHHFLSQPIVYFGKDLLSDDGFEDPSGLYFSRDPRIPLEQSIGLFLQWQNLTNIPPPLEYEELEEGDDGILLDFT
jgi:hypothetical protein